MLSSLFHDYDQEEYTPLISELDRYPVDHPLDTSSISGSECDSDVATDDEDEATLKKNDWLFRLINWDQIFEQAAAHLNINFNDYDYDRYTDPSKDDAIPSNVSSVDTFNYFMSSLSNGNLKVTDKPPGVGSSCYAKSRAVATTSSNDYAVTIYEIIYDRVAKSRLFSLKGILDDVYPEESVTVNRILAEIVSFELAPDTIRHMLYRSIIHEYCRRCRPKWSKLVITASNWLIYIAFFAVHIMWLQFVWVDFLKHFNWRDDPPHAVDANDPVPTPNVHQNGDVHGNAHGNALGNGPDAVFLNDPSFHDPPHLAMGDDPMAASGSIFARGLSWGGASPTTVFTTIGMWQYFQWTTFVLFLLVIAYMAVLYWIARRVDAFGDFLKKLQLTQLLKLGEAKHPDAEHADNVVMLQYAANNPVAASFQIPMESVSRGTMSTAMDGAGGSLWGLDSDNEAEHDSVFTESSEADVWNYGRSVSHGADHGDHEVGADDAASLSMLSSLHSLSGRLSKTSGHRGRSGSLCGGVRADVVSQKLISRIEGLYYVREHLILYTVISLVKMLIIFLYLSVLVLFFLIPAADYWYCWTLILDAFALYVLLKAMKEVYRGTVRVDCTQTAGELDRAEYVAIGSGGAADTASVHSLGDGSLVDIADTDGIFKHEWIVATVNVVSVAALLVVTTYIVAQYMSNYTDFVGQRMVYLQVLAALECLWLGGQLALWKLNFYGTIFYLLLLIPSILFGSASFYALYEYYILSLVHTFLAVIFAAGEFHLVGPHDDDTTLDPADWSVLGVLALCAKLFRFRMPQTIDRL